MINETLVERIKRHEGFCAVPKYDAKDKYVIGYGHDIAPDERTRYENGISIVDAESLLDSDLDFYEDHLFQALPWALWIGEPRQNVLIEMAFQLGVNGVLGFHAMLAAVESKNWDKAVHEMLDSDWHKQTPERCEELANLMLQG